MTNQPRAATFSFNRQHNFGTRGIFVGPNNCDFRTASGSSLIGGADTAYAPNKDFN